MRQKKPGFAMRLRQAIKKLHDASRLLDECQFHMAGAADEIDRLNKEIKKLKRKT
jgi:exonuclease VII small subunit